MSAAVWSTCSAWEKIYCPTFQAHAGLYRLWDSRGWVSLAAVDDFGCLVKVLS